MYLTFAALIAIWLVPVPSNASPINMTNLRMPAHCEGKTFCTTKLENYPENKIESLLQGIIKMFHDLSDTHVGHRQSDDESRSDCKTAVHNNLIYEIIDESDRLRFVVQVENIFMQRIRIAECENPGRLNDSTPHLPWASIKHNNLECKQATLDFHFLVLSLDGNSLESVRAKNGIPVCCSCRLM